MNSLISIVILIVCLGIIFYLTKKSKKLPFKKIEIKISADPVKRVFLIFEEWHVEGSESLRLSSNPSIKISYELGFEIGKFLTRANVREESSLSIEDGKCQLEFFPCTDKIKNCLLGISFFESENGMYLIMPPEEVHNIGKMLMTPPSK